MAAYVFPKLATEIWRLYETDGVPSSGAHKPEKLEIQEWATVVQDTVAALKISELDYTLTAQKDLFVSQTGNDTTGDGSSGNPWATLTKAWTEVVKYDLNNNRLRIRFVGTPTFTTSGTLLQCATWPKGAGTVQILGDATTPANIKIQSTGASPNAVIQVRAPQGAVTLELTGLEFTASGAGAACLDHNGQGKVIVDRCRFSPSGVNAIGIKINGNNSHVECPNQNIWFFGASQGSAILSDSGYFISVGTIVYENTPTYSGAMFEVTFGGRMFLTAQSGAINAASLVRAIVKDRSLLRVHTNSPILGTGNISVQAGSVYDDGGFAVQHSCFPIAHGVVTYSGGVPSFTRNYRFNPTITDVGTGNMQLKLEQRMVDTIYAVVVTQMSGFAYSVSALSIDDDEFQVRIYDAANAAVDAAISVSVFGNQRADF